MALSFASATGNLFNRLGAIGALIEQMRSYQDSQFSNMTNTSTGVVSEFNAESDIQAMMGSQYISLLNSAGNVGTFSQTIAATTINRMVFRDNPLLSQTLQSQTTLASLKEVIRQMKAAGASVLAMTVAATPTAFTGTGNGIINTSVNRPLDGLVLENSFAETFRLVCSSDSYAGGANAGNEGFSISGTGRESNVFAFNWPLGSNASTALNAIDGNSDNAAGNKLTNSGFDAFTSNVPDNWSLVVGTAGTDIFKESSLVFDGAAAVRILGDGATLTQIRQQFDISTGTSGTLSAATQYSFNVFSRRDGVAPAAGVLTVDLFDGSSIINDENGVANSFTIDLTTLTTNYASKTGVFRTPSILPATIYLRMRLSTALTNARSVYFDKASLGTMTQAYTSGPYVAVHAGSIPFEVGDLGTVVITNSRGAAGTLDTWQVLFYRFFADMGNSELLLPSSASPTISDALIA
ncbi:MAG: hypothetical protein Q7O66_07880 [Dehalococcoidia bacterium]|nr:hypothetical protein [Dehalococcoidia bacterium]